MEKPSLVKKKKPLTSTPTSKVKGVSIRREDLTDVEKKARSIRRQIRMQNKTYKQAQRLNRPKLNKVKFLEEFSEYADGTAKKLSNLTLRVMSLQTAFSYAESMIAQDIDGQGVEWQIDSALRIAEKIQVVETTRIMLAHFELPKTLINAIIAQTIAKQFGTPNSVSIPQQSQQTPVNNNSLPTFSSAQVKKVLEDFGKDISGGKP